MWFSGVLFAILSIGLSESFAAIVPEKASITTNLEQLDDFSLMNIFDFLPIADLTKMAILNPRFAEIFRNHYIINKFRLHERQMSFYIGKHDLKLFYADSHEPRNYLAIDLKDILTVMQLFGESFKRIHYDVDVFGTPSSLDVFEYGDKYCSQATKEITIRSFAGDPLAKRSHTFDNTTTAVVIHGHMIDSFSLNDIFPFMRQLIVPNLEKSIVDHYPHLTKCRIRSSYHNLDHANPNVYEFIRLNPQIREFSTRMMNNASYMKYLEDMLPQLETLSIILHTTENINPDHEIVHFKSVKKFSLQLFTNFDELSLRTMISNIQFDQLEVLRFHATWIFFADNRFVETFAANKGLKIIDTNLLMTIEAFNSLVQALPELNEITIEWHNQMLDTLRAFFTANNKINKIHFLHYVDTNVDDLREGIPWNWEIVKIPPFKLSIIRK